MAARRALTALLFCLTLCVSSPLQGSEEADVAWLNEVTLLDVTGSGDVDIATLRDIVRTDKEAAEHIADAEAAHAAAVPTEAAAEKPAEHFSAEQAADDQSKSAQSSDTMGVNHDSAWHCNHCDSSCKTEKCRSWCQDRWCNKE